MANKTAEVEHVDEDAQVKSRRPIPKGAKWAWATLGEYGPNLPIGVLSGGKERVKPFRLRRFSTKIELEIGEIRKKSKKMRLSNFVSSCLSLLVQTIGPHNFDTLEDKARKLILSELLFPDVLYLWMYLRHDAMEGEPLVMNVQCPRCNFGGADSPPVGFDMSTLDVRVLPIDCVDLRMPYVLRRGIEVRKQEYNELQIAPFSWATFDDADFANQSDAKREAMMVRNSIVGINGFDNKGPLVITEEEIGTMSKFDKEGLIRHIEDMTPGPQMVAELDCPDCGNGLYQQIDWTYENFFRRRSPATIGK